MTSEEMQKAMAFVLEQQAQLTSTVGQLSEKVDGLAATVDRLAAKVDGLVGTVDHLAVKVDRTADGITALLAIAEIHEREFNSLNESGQATADAIRARAEAGRATDERLNALLNVVEQMISERRGGERGGGSA